MVKSFYTCLINEQKDKHMETRLKEAKMLVELKRFDEAKEILMPIFEEREKDDQMYFLLGKCFLETGDNSNAVRFFQKAVDLKPREAEYLLALATAQEAFGDTIQAMDTYLKILALSPESVVASERMMALIKSIDKP